MDLEPLDEYGVVKLMSTERTDKIGFGDLRLTQRPEDFCYGVDAVILADFAAQRAKSHMEIMDLGTGNGIIPLILSHKTPAKNIYGLEVQAGAYETACKNVDANGLSERIHIIHGNVKDIGLTLLPEWNGFMDLVVSNPPYMAHRGGLTNQNPAKTIARHETEGTLSDFIHASARLLKEKGHLCMIHRPNRLVDLFCMARNTGLEPKALRLVCPKQGESPNIVMVHFIKGGGKELRILPMLNIYQEDGHYTDEVMSIYEK
jgi:tRNA1Val (adenine37-N6)-methyltransferase